MPTLELPECLFLHTQSYLAECRYIDAPAGNGLTEDYTPDERFLTRISLNQPLHFSLYGGTQSEYGHRIGETALALSRILWACDGNLTGLAGQFDLYRQGYDDEANPHGLYTPALNNTSGLPRVLWSYTGTSCELFFSYLACHRHWIALKAMDDDEPGAGPFGRNRYFEYLTAPTIEDRCKSLNYLDTNLDQEPYLTSLQKFYEKHGHDKKNFFIHRELNETTCPFGCLQNGRLINWLTPPNCYTNVFTHMDALFLAITGPELPDIRTFLEKVFELQYWYIHIMPCDRGSLAVMNMFRFTMMAYYNRRQPDQAKWLPIAPNRTNIYPDLEALLLCASLETFIEASFQDLYCVNYATYGNG